MRSVFEQIAHWQLKGVPVVRVAVNVSAVQLERQLIGDVVRGVLKVCGREFCDRPTVSELREGRCRTASLGALT